MAISQNSSITASDINTALDGKASSSHTHGEYQKVTVYEEQYLYGDYTIPTLDKGVKYIYYFENLTSSSIGIYTPRRGTNFYEYYVTGNSYPSIGTVGGSSKKLIDLKTKGVAVVAIERIK